MKHRFAHLTPAVWTLAAGLAVSTGAFAQPNVAKPVPQPGGPATKPNLKPNRPSTIQPGAAPAAGGASPKGPGAQPGAQPGGPQPAGQPGAQPTHPATLTPAPAGAGANTGQGDNPDEQIMLPAFAEPVQLSTLIELVAKTLNINITTQGEIQGTVVFNAPVPVKKSELLGLLDAFLEQVNYTIDKDRFGLYTVHPITNVSVKFAGGGEFATTRIFRTPNLKPSALKTAIEGQMGLPPATPTGPRQTAYLDDLGIIVATDTPRRLEAMNDLIQKLLEEDAKSTFTRLELHFLAAPVARERALQLVGQMSQTTARPGTNQPPPVAQGVTGSLDNIGDRLTIDPQGNALIFRGVPQEIAQVQAILNVIDVPNNLEPKSYFAGSAASQIANIAHQRGLGEVTTISDNTQGGAFDANAVRQNIANNMANQAQLAGGPVMVVNETSGNIIYYGTPSQQLQLKALVEQLDTQAEKVIIGVYKLKNSKAEDVAQIIQNVISSTQPLGSSSLIPGQNQQGGRFNRNRTNPNPPPNAAPRGTGQPGELALDTGFVIADPANNQLLVKAPAGQQPEFAKLIDKLDLRRAQVYIEAKIVAVNWSNDTRIAFENQLINAGGTGGLINTNFGLSSFGTSGAITGPKVVSTALGGLTGAVVKSDMVPLIVNALQTKANARVLSIPQILVNDNEQAEITSVDTQPTSVTSQTNGNGLLTSAGPNEEAGTKLTVEPHISESGYLSLKYDIELSSFTGTQTVTASGTLPSPKQVNKIGSDAVTVPTDSTVIVGGLDFDSTRLTRAQVPLLGDIPLIGLLFQDRNSNDRTTTLYVFLTPKVLRDPNFADLRLLTAGPQAEMRLGSDIPPLSTAPIDMDQPSPAPYKPIEPAPLGAPAAAPPAAAPRKDDSRAAPPPAPLRPDPVQTPGPAASPAGGSAPAPAAAPPATSPAPSPGAAPAATPASGQPQTKPGEPPLAQAPANLPRDWPGKDKGAPPPAPLKSGPG